MTIPHIKTNELKKHDYILLRSGWLAEITDNMRGNTRTAEVHGWFTEIESVYSHDIVAKIDTVGPEGTGFGVLAYIQHTPAQEKLAKLVGDW